MEKEVHFSKNKVLKYLASFDPDLAEKITSEPEDLEEYIAEELKVWSLVKDEKLRQIDLETLMSCFSFFKDIMKISMSFYAGAAGMFFKEFMAQYEYTAQAVAEGLKQREDPRIRLVDKTCEIIDRIFDRMNFNFIPQTTTGVIIDERRRSGSKSERTRKGRDRVSKKADSRTTDGIQHASCNAESHT